MEGAFILHGQGLGVEHNHSFFVGFILVLGKPDKDKRTLLPSFPGGD